MAGILASLTEEQQQVCRLLPFPIASSWQQVLLASSRAQLDQRLSVQVEVIARTLGVLVLCDYLRGPVEEPVEVLLERLVKPVPEDWVALIGAGLDALARRREPPVMLDAAVAWQGRRAQADRAGLEQLAWCVELRRLTLTSTGVESGFDASGQTDQLLQAVLDLVESLRWLGAWRLLRVVELTTQRHRGFSGRVQLFQGADESPTPVQAAWTAHLVMEAVYLIDAGATQVLEVSPLVRVLPHPRHRRPLCFLVDHSPGLDRLILAGDASGVRVETTIAGPQGEMPFAEWLARRQEHGAWLANQDIAGTMTVDGSQAVYLPARHTVPPRPISDLSQFAFRRQKPRSTIYDSWSARGALIAQLAIVAALGAATLIALAPRFRKTSARIDEAAARPRPTLHNQDASTRRPTESASRRPPQPLASAPAPQPPVLASAQIPQHAPPALPIPVPAAVPAAVPVAAPVAAQVAVPVAVPAAVPVPVPAPAPVAAPAPAPAPVVAPAPVPAPAVAVAPRSPPAAAPPKPTSPAGAPPAAAPSALLQTALREAALRPSYAILKLEVARHRGVAGATAALAAVQAAYGSKPACRHLALLALAEDPGNTQLEELVGRCGGQPQQAKTEPAAAPPRAKLAADLYAEGYSIIYGGKHAPADRRRMAKSMYTLAIELGSVKAHTGIAAIYLYAERNRTKCHEHAAAAVAAGEGGQARQLLKACEP